MKPPTLVHRARQADEPAYMDPVCVYDNNEKSYTTVW